MSSIDKKRDNNPYSGVPYHPRDFNKTHDEVVTEAIPKIVDYINGLLYLNQDSLAVGKACEVYDQSNSIEWQVGAAAAVGFFRQLGWRVTLSDGKYYFYLPEKKDGE